MESGRCSLWEGISIGEGCKGDYAALGRWHYRGGMPVAVVRVLVARYGGGGEGSRKLEVGSRKLGEGSWEGEGGSQGEVVGVLVETRPVLNCRLRNVAMGGRYVGVDKRGLARRLNAEVTTIARVVVVPRYRGLGLAVALVERALETGRTGYVEALASMGRVQPFFEQAGMRRYDRPMPAESVRLMAALAREHVVPGDLAGLMPWQVSGFLAGELRRFVGRRGKGRGGRGKEIGTAIEEARRRVGSWPAYYAWRRPGSGLPALAEAGEVGGMAEALTVFMSAREKAGVVAALGRVHPDMGRALVMMAGG